VKCFERDASPPLVEPSMARVGDGVNPYVPLVRPSLAQRRIVVTAKSSKNDNAR